MEKVSIVVPVYNVERDIIRCLISLKNQSYQNIEVIVLNDGSSDKSGYLAKEFCDSDDRFFYYSHENIGLGLTRNKGIKLATGDYITFVDSDDCINVRSIEKLVNKAVHEKSDVVCGEIVRITSKGKKTVLSNYKNLDSISMSQIEIAEFYKKFFFTSIYSTNAVNKLYKRKIIAENNIMFGDNKKVYGEDQYFQLQLLNVVSKISFIHFPVYYYVIREDSISQSIQKDIIGRQLYMANFFESISNGKYSRQIASVIAFNGIFQEISNNQTSKLGFNNFYKKMNNARENPYFNEKIQDINEEKGYQLIENRIKRIFYVIVSFLEKKELNTLSTTFIYCLLKTKNKMMNFKYS